MQGTLVCAMTDEEDRTVLQTAVELSERLGLRLVLAYVRDGISPPAEEAEHGTASVSMSVNRQGAAHLLARLAAEHGVADRAEQRSGAGDAAAVIGQATPRQ
jgi:hypothetical protein